MSTPPFLPLYVADYIADTQALTTEQHGAYFLLLMAAWKLGGRLPNDSKHLARFAKCHPSRWSRIGGQVLEFFEVDDSNCLVSPRLLQEYEKAAGIRNQRAQVGRTGGEATALKRKKTGPAIGAPSQNPDIQISSSLRSEGAREEVDDLFGELFDQPAPKPPGVGQSDALLNLLDQIDKGRGAVPSSGAVAGEIVAQPLGLSELAARVWNAMAPEAKTRLKGGAKSIHRALKAAKAEGADVDRIAAECAAYYGHPDQHDQQGRFAKGPWTLIRDGYWKEWRGDAFHEVGPAPRRELERANSGGPFIVLFRGVGYAAPPGCTIDPECADVNDPGVHLQQVWLDDWYGYHPGDRFRHWSRDKRGPQPGEPGCRVWPSVFERHPAVIREEARKAETSVD